MLAAGVAALTLIVLPATALGASGAPITLDANGASGAPSLAVDDSGTAYVAWMKQDLTAATNNIQWCVIPAGQTACAHAGGITFASGSAVYVRTIGGKVFLIAEHYASAELVNEWVWDTATSTFDAVDSGQPVAHSAEAFGYYPTGPVVLPTSDTSTHAAFGFDWWNSAGSPEFTDWSANNATTCTLASCPSWSVATLDQSSPGGALSQGSAAAVASITTGPNQGVIASDLNEATTGPLACPNGAFGTTFAYGTGVLSGSNRYSVSPGTSGTAWQPAKLVSCSLNDVAVTGSAKYGFGVFAYDSNGLEWVPFQASTVSLGTPVKLPGPDKVETSPWVSSDTAGNLYATFWDGEGLNLAYSSDGGASWNGPQQLVPGTDITDTDNAVDASGQGWVTYTSGNQVEVQQFVATDADAAPTTLTTKSSLSSLASGTETVYDNATVAGTMAAGATGDVTYGLYSSASCTASSRVFDAGAAAVGYPSKSTNVTLAAGTYYWQAIYGGDSFNAPSTSQCGSDVVTVTATPTKTGPGNGTGTGSGTGTTPNAGPPTGSDLKTQNVHGAKGVTVATPGTVTVTGRSGRYLTVSLSSPSASDKFLIQLLGKPKKAKHAKKGRRHAKPKPAVLAHTSVTVHTLKGSQTVQLALPASIAPGTYTLAITVSSTGRHHQQLGRITRKVTIV